MNGPGAYSLCKHSGHSLAVKTRWLVGTHLQGYRDIYQCIASVASTMAVWLQQRSKLNYSKTAGCGLLYKPHTQLPSTTGLACPGPGRHHRCALVLHNTPTLCWANSLFFVPLHLPPGDWTTQGNLSLLPAGRLTQEVIQVPMSPASLAFSQQINKEKGSSIATNDLPRTFYMASTIYHVLKLYTMQSFQSIHRVVQPPSQSFVDPIHHLKRNPIPISSNFPFPPKAPGNC